MVIHTPLVISAVAVATVATMIFIGLGHLPKPTRATAIWSCAFAAAMVGSYVWLGGDTIESTQLRGVANGLLFGSMLLVWSGVRSFRGKPSQLVLSISLIVCFSLLSLGASYTIWYGISFRALTAFIAIFAALTIFELLGLGEGVRDEVLPLVAVSALFIVSACISVVDGILVATGVTNAPDSLFFIRGVNIIGANVLILCALVTVLQLATRDETVRFSSSQDVFETVASDRLRRAKAIADPWWSFVDIRLDDPDDLRTASSTAMFNEVSDRFRHEVYSALPADADIKLMSPTRIIALVPRAQGGMREILSDVLRRINAVDIDGTLPVRLSASIGWTHAPSADYNFDTLLGVAANAARVAREAGGDRWERVHGND